MDTPAEAVVAVVGNDMGVIRVVYDITRFCKSEGIYCVVSAKDGGGSTQQRWGCPGSFVLLRIV